MSLSRADCLRELGLLPAWRLRGGVSEAPAEPVAPAARRPEPRLAGEAAGATHLRQGIHTRGYLPHVKAEGASYFVTFRLADSLPVEVLESWADQSEEERARSTERYLDQGAGECLLARPEIADIVVEALKHQAGTDYTLHEYVVMPNHVHLLITPQGEHTLSGILHSVKSWSAHTINKLLERNGTLWQHESYDRIVRNDEEMQALAAYVRRNPVKARLCHEESEYRWGSAGQDAGGTPALQVAPASRRHTGAAEAEERASKPPSGVAPASRRHTGAAEAEEPASKPPALHAPPALQALDWPALTAAIRACTLCPLHQTRTQGVPGVGDIHAEWLFIGEAPGADEDRLGEPFVGQAGKLLDAMLAALRLKRGENVYIANVLKSRPPGNRDPQPEEVAACRPYLERQIELIQPKLIVALGRIAAQNLLQTDTPIGRLRGQVHEYCGVPLVVTYHPAYLLRSPAEKLRAWADLVLARNTMNALKANQPT